MAHQARKRFGQNFLQDQRVINRIIDSIAPTSADRLVEIGPGKGAITQPLLRTCGKLDVIELDRDLIQPLANKCQSAGELTIHQHDALTFDFKALAKTQKLRVVGNLPYNISTPLLFHLIDQANSIHDMFFMLQKEVVNRLAATPGARSYGRLSVIMQYHCQVTPLFDIGPEAFDPAPKVDSTFVRLIPWTKPPVTVNHYPTFEKLVKSAFAQKRKTLRNNLKGILDANAIQQTGIDPSIRAEKLTLEKFATLANQLQAV
ncbi:MAG: 16S rRNA (adenine(1518)-N(6)/adenine(1519)-N(6))-dimethyltransferase RsmA [Gammaproteobacteria bacterium]